MQSELEVAIENLNSDGAKLFKLSEYEEAKRLGNKGQLLEGFCLKVEKLSKEWMEHFAETSKVAGISGDTQDTARTILSHSKSAKTRLLIRFPDGTIISEPAAADSLVLAIEKIGFERVSQVGVLVNKENVVSSKPSPKGYGETKKESFYIKTHSSTDQKKRNLEKISDELELFLDVEVL